MKKNKTSLQNIPVSGSLGLLAFGDLAFEQWRKAKKDHNIISRGEQEKRK
ncbi:hypothetical protein N9906_00350 [Flavobacteriaceae bacterium]|nr:hypothetical protein [Flavobacteriaceae bacterium]MDB4298436.1 hypothetical protein [Flavobacteriaceae bacterium]MDB9912573.1 hypothetical protein [Flavobacteriaceae bacterium]